MISFRYHLVSIVGVLVALAVGILIGGTILNKGFEQNLKHQLSGLSQSVDNLHKVNLALQAELRNWESFGAQSERWLAAGRLTDQPVVLVVDRGVDAGEVAGVRQALQYAGASPQGVVVLEPRISDPSAKADLAKAVGLPPSTSRGRLDSATARGLAGRLMNGAPSIGADPLLDLKNGGFVSVSDEAKGGLRALGGPGQSVVFLGGGPTPAVSTTGFTMSFLQTLAAQRRPAVAAQSSAATGAQSYLSAVRSDGALNGHIVTVDNVDQVPGQSALVLGLAQMLQAGNGGNYGTCDSCTLLPRP